MARAARLTSSASRREIGSYWEKKAESFLHQQGLTTVKRNYHCRLGEIDLVMNDADTMVFVEVRYRMSNRHGSPAETVTRRKQNRLINAARCFLGSNPKLSQKACRFDVISIAPGRVQPELQWIKNAFDATPG